MFSKEMFCIPQHYEDYLESVLVPKGLILNRSVTQYTLQIRDLNISTSVLYSSKTDNIIIMVIEI